MTRLILLAASGLLLATANSPPATEGELTSVVAAPAPAPVAESAKPMKAQKPAPAAAAAYPPCSATVRDRCQQRGSYAARPVRQREIQYAMRAGERG
ncbi:MAG TPA: hypothetical protein VEA60_11235 [Allosphingosinicella sp.]|nr:hypothetical protein [Allosphingosinicella sp.]